ncbi:MULTISPECIES: DUF1853 family protein [unclassified Massilia]|uniref:DUF1853 family protein n=1 Tax=unclassified Massilia TaxID=2609279 RepID=UPI00177F043C|nr:MULTISPECIES: DUF1853 family protein [unclassified Massilia]MBD8531109.1 DUF1853 family protein [Massilia sp. CFBP 13647]MBD8674945.1 DUF1853 family protein [Massilia sp. CFBP 13721]
MQDAPASYQHDFHRRWGHLRRARVRALAWLLDSPDLLDAAAPHWQGRIASTGSVTPEVARWLAGLDHDPAPLDAALGARVYTRLGLYAEKLMAFYFQQQGRLVAHGLQIRANRNDTVGEFDFLLDAGPDALEHIEFATKFYLLQGEAGQEFDALVGPNLADSLGAKMRKIFGRQLELGAHPAAQPLLPRPVTAARALVKGWLFYPSGSWPAMSGITAGHCRGFWCALGELGTLGADAFMVLPKLQWLAPFRSVQDVAVMNAAQLHAALEAQFETNAAPVLVAVVRAAPGLVEEVERGFIVPNDWRARAEARSAKENMRNIVW